MADRSTNRQELPSRGSPVIRVDEWNNSPIDGMKSLIEKGQLESTGRGGRP